MQVLAESSYCEQKQVTVFSQSRGMIHRGDLVADYGQGEV